MSAAKMRFAGVLPAGDYYIGDPSYLFEHETWLSVREAYEKAAKKLDDDAATFFFGRFKCFVSPTNGGDGNYRDQNGGAYDVDTGLIGAIPAKATVVRGNPIHFDGKFKVGADRGRSIEGKRIQIGHLIIRT